MDVQKTNNYTPYFIYNIKTLLFVYRIFICNDDVITTKVLNSIAP